MKTMKLLGLIIIVLFLSCELSAPIPAVSFAEVSDPYRRSYGSPEDVTIFTSGDYQTIDWWWWSQGFCVGFINSPYDNTNGWRVDNTYAFAPID